MNPPSRKEQLRFFGDYPQEWFTKNKKISTVRKFDPEKPKYQFTSGQEVDAVVVNGDNEFSAPITILRVQTSKLKELPPGLLLGDGFRSVDEAAQTLDGIKGYSPFNPDTIAIGILFMSTPAFQATRTNDLFFDYYVTRSNASISKLMNFDNTQISMRFRDFFFSSWAFWLIEFHKTPIKEFANALSQAGIISSKLAEDMNRRYVKSRQSRGEMRKIDLRDYLLGYGISK